MKRVRSQEEQMAAAEIKSRIKSRKTIGRTTVQLTGFEGDPKRKAAIEKAMKEAGIEVIQEPDPKE